MITLPVVNDHDVLVFRVEDVRALRHHGVCATFMGTLSHYQQQNVFMLVPMRLMIWEALWLVHHQIAQLVDYKHYRTVHPSTQPSKIDNGSMVVIDDDEAESDKELLEQHTINAQQLAQRFINAHPQYTPQRFITEFWNYVHLKDQYQFYISPGLKFGGDLVCYPGDPLKYHSYAVVRYAVANLMDLVVAGRLATLVKKTILLIDDAEEDTSTENGLEQLLKPRAKRTFSIEWAGFG